MRSSGHIVLQIVTKAHGHEIKHLPSVEVRLDFHAHPLPPPATALVSWQASDTAGPLMLFDLFSPEARRVQITDVDMLQVPRALCMRRAGLRQLAGPGRGPASLKRARG